jgi:hypothetical protein
MTLIVLGELEQIDRLHRFIRGDSLPPKTGT